MSDTMDKVSDADLDCFWPIRRCRQICNSLFQNALEPWGLTQMQFGCLQIIEQRLGLDQTTLAKLADVDRSTMTDIVRRLEKKGLIYRTPAETDKRQVLISLTPKGEETLDLTRPMLERVTELYLEPLEPHERAFFQIIMMKIINFHEGPPTKSSSGTRPPAAQSRSSAARKSGAAPTKAARRGSKTTGANLAVLESAKTGTVR